MATATESGGSSGGDTTAAGQGGAQKSSAADFFGLIDSNVTEDTLRAAPGSDGDDEEGINDEFLATVLVIVLGIITILFNAGHYAYSSAEQRDQDLYIMTTFGASIRFSVQRAITAD